MRFETPDAQPIGQCKMTLPELCQAVMFHRRTNPQRLQVTELVERLMKPRTFGLVVFLVVPQLSDQKKLRFYAACSP